AALDNLHVDALLAHEIVRPESKLPHSPERLAGEAREYRIGGIARRRWAGRLAVGHQPGCWPAAGCSSTTNGLRGCGQLLVDPGNDCTDIHDRLRGCRVSHKACRRRIHVECGLGSFKCSDCVVSVDPAAGRHMPANDYRMLIVWVGLGNKYCYRV